MHCMLDERAGKFKGRHQIIRWSHRMGPPALTERCFSGELEVRAPDRPMLPPDYASELLIEASNCASEAAI
jgi:hypothetical protein